MIFLPASSEPKEDGGTESGRQTAKGNDKIDQE